MDFWEDTPAGIIFPMRRFWMTLPLLFLTVSLFPSIRADAQPGHFSPNPAAADLIQAINDLRESQGLEPYEPHPILMSIAQTHANYISGTGVMTHFDAQGRRPYQRALDFGYAVGGDISLGGTFAEAIYSASGATDEEVIAAWQANESDSAALLSAEYKDIGVGIAAANGKTYYVLNVGAEGDAIEAGLSTTGTPDLQDGTPLPNTPLPGGEIYHVVRKNEALWSIAILYETSIQELKLLNSLASDEIFEGQRLLIRRANTETPTPTLEVLTATLGIPTSTATRPVAPTATYTPTPKPTPPTSLQAGATVVGGITLVALLAAALVAFLGRRGKK
jgi:uncharacterized protein YkwD